MATLPRFTMLWATVLVALPLRAHDLMESFIEAIVRPDLLELNITMGPGTALKLVDPTATPQALTPEILERYRSRLLHEGAALFSVTSSKARLAPTRVEIKLTDEKDVAFKVIYPCPPPGLLIFKAAFLERLGAGFGGIIDATDTFGHQLGWDQITWENPTLVVVLPAPVPAPK